MVFSIIGKCYGQKIDKSLGYFSIEPFINYPYYQFIETYPNYKNKPNYNYGAGFFIALSADRASIKTGVWYSTKEYYERPNYIGKTVDRIDYSIDYFNIPIIWAGRINKNPTNKNQFYFSAGVIFNNANKYRSVTHYSNGKVLSENLPFDKVTGLSIRFGLRYMHHFSDHWGLFADAYSDIKIIREYIESHPGHGGGGISSGHIIYDRNLPDDRLLSGINIGFAYCFPNKGKFYEWLRDSEGNEQQ